MKHLFLISVSLLAFACRSKAPSQQEDQLYSRHLQRQVKLTIINTPIPSDKADLNLLIVNDGQDAGEMRLKHIVDSLDAGGLLQPLLVVAVHAGERMQEYGISGKPDYEKRGTRADHYNAFIGNELYDFIKKKSGTRKFKSVAVAGWSLGGLSAFDIAWNNYSKIDKAGIFSGSFWWRDKDSKDSSYSDDKNRIVLPLIRAARRKPSTQYWFYAGAQEENSDRDKDGITDVVDDTQDMRAALISKGLVNAGNCPLVIDPQGKHDIPSWSKHFPEFLIWAFGK